MTSGPDSGHPEVRAGSGTHANARLEAFCDAVFAIAMTLLILDIKVPDPGGVHSTGELWLALQRLVPPVLAFVMSFLIVLITWVDHHGAVKLVRGSSPSFMYANGLLLLTVVFLPFPTALLGAYIGTDHAAPAVVLYDAVVAVQAVAWFLLNDAALRNHLGVNQGAIAELQTHRRQAVWAFVLYTTLAAAAVWFPLAVAIVTAVTWTFWLIVGVRIKAPEE
jgi:TMEM175 potassium channel family protein